MCILVHKVKKNVNQPIELWVMYKLTFLLIFPSISNKNITHLKIFNISDYIFRKVQGSIIV